jgi:hypothetical protein
MTEKIRLVIITEGRANLHFSLFWRTQMICKPFNKMMEDGLSKHGPCQRQIATPHIIGDFLDVFWIRF